MYISKIVVLYIILVFLYFKDNVIRKLEALSLCIQFWCICSVLAKCFKCLNVALNRIRVRTNQGYYLNNKKFTFFFKLEFLLILERILVLAKPLDLFILPDRFTMPSNIVIYLQQLNRAHADLCSIIDHTNSVYQVLLPKNYSTKFMA